MEITFSQIQTKSLETKAKYCINFLEKKQNADFHFLDVFTKFYFLLTENTLQVQNLRAQMTKTANPKEFNGCYEHCISQATYYMPSFKNIYV